LIAAKSGLHSYMYPMSSAPHSRYVSAQRQATVLTDLVFSV